MLNQPAPFPYPGSTALLGDRKVKIIRVEGDGRRYVQGKGVARTVYVDQLSDATLDGAPFDRWYAERTAALDDAAIGTPVVDLYDDYRLWLAARGCTITEMPTHIAFGRMLGALGLVSTIRRVDGSQHRCVPLALKQPVLA